MQPLSPMTSPVYGGPNIELLRRNGWSVSTIAGPYCVAWRGQDEAVFQWTEGGWRPLRGPAGGDGI